MLKLESRLSFPAYQYFVHIQFIVQTFASQVYLCLFEVGNPILGQHNQDLISQMKYTTVVDCQEC